MPIKLVTKGEVRDPSKTYFSTRSLINPQVERTIEIDMHPAEFNKLYAMYRDDCLLIQDVFYMLDEDTREFIMTGVTPDEWNTLTDEDEED